MAYAQMTYFRMYRAKKDPTLLTTSELGTRWTANPWLFYRDIWGVTSRKLDVLDELQTDPELERARQRVGRLFWIVCACLFGGWLLTILLTLLGAP